MKKLLLALTLAVTTVFGISAEDITADFSAQTSATPTNTESKITTGEGDQELTWTLDANARINVYSNAYYLQLNYGSSGASGGSATTVVAPEIASITLTTSSNCSTQNGNTIKITINGNDVVSGYAINKHDETYQIPIPADLRAANATYVFEADGSKNSQIKTLVFVEATDDPKISLSPTEMSFMVPLKSAEEKTFTILSENVTKNISLSVDNDDFSVPESVTPEEGEAGVTLKYTGSKAGNVEATLTVSVGSLSETIALTATTLSHAGTEDDPLSVEDVIKMNNINKGPFYVSGIISQYCAANAKDGVLQTTETVVASNLVLEDENENRIPVQLPSGSSAKSLLNISDNPDNVAQTIVIYGTLENYFSAPGVKNTEYISGLPEVEAGELEDLAAFIEKADTKTPYYIKCPVTVLYAYTFGQVMYVTDGTTNLCIYGELWSYHPGDVIPGGFKGTYSETSGGPSMVNPSDFGVAISGKAPTPVEKAISEITEADLYSYVKLTNVTFTASGNNITFTAVTETEPSRATEEEAAATLAGYNSFSVSLPTDDKAAYDVTGIVSTYNDTVELLPIEFTETVTTGICSIAADDASAPVEFFNLQGQPIANPENGLYIRRQGTNVTKIVIP